MPPTFEGCVLAVAYVAVGPGLGSVVGLDMDEVELVISWDGLGVGGSTVGEEMRSEVPRR